MESAASSCRALTAWTWCPWQPRKPCRGQGPWRTERFGSPRILRPRTGRCEVCPHRVKSIIALDPQHSPVRLTLDGGRQPWSADPQGLAQRRGLAAYRVLHGRRRGCHGQHIPGRCEDHPGRWPQRASGEPTGDRVWECAGRMIHPGARPCPGGCTSLVSVLEHCRFPK